MSGLDHMTFQMDLGNALVGLGTIILAMVTFIVTNRNIQESRRAADRTHKAEGRRRLAEKRLSWIEELRKEIGELLALVANHDARDLARGDRMNALSTVVSLRLATDKESHKELNALIQSVLRMVDLDNGTSALTKEAGQALLIELAATRDKCRLILREEWMTVKNELLSDDKIEN